MNKEIIMRRVSKKNLIDDSEILDSSFRDPSGFVFSNDGIIYRQINKAYKEEYDLLMGTGLYEKLIDNRLLISHKEVIIKPPETQTAYKIIKPSQLSFISYPYEWSFSQLKDAALTTLRVQKEALNFNMSLKDCSAYNIQFDNGKPKFIDTLSFEQYVEGEPWVAYKQFCQHFLAPLALMAKVDISFNKLFIVFIDGLPLTLASSLLHKTTYFKFSMLTHIHLHAKSQTKYSGKHIKVKRCSVKRNSFLGLIDNLETSIKSLTLKDIDTEWRNYYDNTNYTEMALKEKKIIIEYFIKIVNPSIVWDIGANNGFFSRIASNKGIKTISFDIDPLAIEKNYLESKKYNEKTILPLLIDLTNPSPSIGWANNERMSLYQRGPADLIFSLALIHHITISNNIPFINVSKYFSSLCTFLVIEFIPKSDSQVEKLLVTRKDVFPNYNQECFEKDFSNFFNIIESKQIKGTERTLYLMKKK
jgi:ribosomal protein L11 methylase PrmA